MEETLARIIAMRKSDWLPIIEREIPEEIIEEYKRTSGKKYRDRKYSFGITLEGLIYQASQSDKSEQYTVVHISEHYKQLQKEYEILQAKEMETKALKKNYEKPGRPKSNIPHIQKSKLQELSLNTASYDEARKRLPVELVKKVFESTAEKFQPAGNESETTWKGHNVFATDGTTFKMVDSEELRNTFKGVNESQPQPVPVGRLQGLVNLYKGGLVAVEIDSYGSSEGRMLKRMYSHIPEGTILLGDDLYSSYGHFAYSQKKNIHMISQGKHHRNESIVKVFSGSDCLVKLTRSRQEPRWYDESDELPEEMIVRKITVINAAKPNEVINIYTTLLDCEKYPAADIAVLYLFRWDIEITFRQIKTILEMEYLRGKTVDMVMKEIYAHLIFYNIIRKLIMENSSTINGAFSPCSSSIQIDLPMVKNENQYIDKLGRSYSRKGGKRVKVNT